MDKHQHSLLKIVLLILPVINLKIFPTTSEALMAMKWGLRRIRWYSLIDLTSAKNVSSQRWCSKVNRKQQLNLVRLLVLDFWMSNNRMLVNGIERVSICSKVCPAEREIWNYVIHHLSMARTAFFCWWMNSDGCWLEHISIYGWQNMLLWSSQYEPQTDGNWRKTGLVVHKTFRTI